MLYCKVQAKYCVPFHLFWLHFAVAREGENRISEHKSPFVVVLSTTLCSLDANIRLVRTTALDKGQEQS